MSRLLQNNYFVKNLPPLSVITEVLLVDTLDCHHLACQIMDSKVHLTERTLTQYLANTVEVDRGGRNDTRVFKGQLDVPDYLLPNLLLRCQFLVMLNRAVGFNPNVSVWRALLIGEARNKIILLHACFRCL